MSDMKCPICGNVLEQSDGFPELFMCLNCQINMKHNQWLELIRTRKALDVAKYALKNIQEDMKERKDGDDIWEIQKNLHDYCKTTIKQITTLEQKDVK
ncbi:MAG: hypothetical protein II843_01445 [Alphaproteobacteria bacterium]|nr:hypothetical protein [Alphaproteobacteria bacterium]